MLPAPQINCPHSPRDCWHIKTVVDVVLAGGHRHRKDQLLRVWMLFLVLVEGDSQFLFSDCWSGVVSGGQLAMAREVLDNNRWPLGDRPSRQVARRQTPASGSPGPDTDRFFRPVVHRPVIDFALSCSSIISVGRQQVGLRLVEARPALRSMIIARRSPLARSSHLGTWLRSARAGLAWSSLAH